MLDEIEMFSRIEIPTGAKFLKCAFQDARICLWMLVETDNEKEFRFFEVLGTGYKTDVETDNYLDTIFINGFVWHIFEIKPKLK